MRREPNGRYKITLADGQTRVVDVAVEEDWGDIQQMNPGDVFKNMEDDPEDWFDRVGWGNDEDGHIEIVDVVNEKNKHLDPREWAKNSVWKYASYYSA